MHVKMQVFFSFISCSSKSQIIHISEGLCVEYSHKPEGSQIQNILVIKDESEKQNILYFQEKSIDKYGNVYWFLFDYDSDLDSVSLQTEPAVTSAEPLKISVARSTWFLE